MNLQDYKQYENLILYCSSLYEERETLERPFVLRPSAIDEIEWKEGIVYFYHPSERHLIANLSSLHPSVIFSLLDISELDDFLGKADQLIYQSRLLAQLNINLDKVYKNEKKFAHILKRNLGEEEEAILANVLANDDLVFEQLDSIEFCALVKKVFVKKLKKIELVPIDEVDEVSPFQYPLYLGKKIFVLTLDFKRNDEFEQICLTSILFYWSNRFLELTSQEMSAGTGESLWEKVFSTIPIPMALISDEGEAILHNKEFVKLSILPTDCLNIESGERIDSSSSHYIVDKLLVRKKLEDTSLEKNESVYLFLFRHIGEIESEQNGDRSRSISSEELGIISSSIAHELNNPLAGVLAAISLLELDSWNDEDTQHLQEMKESALRCRDLVDIFLGFSKVGQGNARMSGLCESLNQSLKMLRFRMIESNYRFDFSFEKEAESFEKKVNFSMASMLFYLILGEILTAAHHHQLVAGERGQKVIKAKFTEDADRAVIEFNGPIHYQRKVLDSKLIRYLVDIENLTLDVQGRFIYITEWKLM